MKPDITFILSTSIKSGNITFCSRNGWIYKVVPAMSVVIWNRSELDRSMCILRLAEGSANQILIGDNGLLHVLWQVSFGCWVTWSISSWQEYYQSVFFPKMNEINDKIYNYSKKPIALVNLAKLIFWLILSFKNLQDWKVNTFLIFSGES